MRRAKKPLYNRKYFPRIGLDRNLEWASEALCADRHLAPSPGACSPGSGSIPRSSKPTRLAKWQKRPSLSLVPRASWGDRWCSGYSTPVIRCARQRAPHSHFQSRATLPSFQISAAPLTGSQSSQASISSFTRPVWLIPTFATLPSVRAQADASSKLTVRETDDARPTNEYGRTKLAAESVLRASGVPFTVLRPVAVYGPHPRGNVKALLQYAMMPWPLPIRGLTNLRSLLGIDNLTSAILFVLDTPATMNETYLVADSAPYSVGEIITMLRKAQGRRSGLFYIPPALLHLAFILLSRGRTWSRLAEDLVVDTGKLQALGWHSTVDTYDGMVAMLRAEGAPLRDKKLTSPY